MSLILFLFYSIQDMKYNGELRRIRELYWYKNVKDSDEQRFEISMETVSPLFIILLAGILVATLLLVSERGRSLILHKRKRSAYEMSQGDSNTRLNTEVQVTN
jgi:hypothetical protein